MPALPLVTRLRTSTLRADLLGGLTTAIVSLPMALAFGLASGAGPQAGLYGAIGVGLFAALFGGTGTLISEPTGPMTVTMTAVISRLTAGNPEHGLAMAFTVVMIAGLVQLIFGALKLGRYITLMPYSVISGFMSGIGILLVLTQIAPLVGLPAPGGGALGAIRGLPEVAGSLRSTDALLAAVALAVLFLTPRVITRRVPGPLLALAAGLAVALLVLPAQSYQQIGAIPMGLPQLVLPRFSAGQVTTMVLDGLVLGVLGCIDSLLTAMIADSLTGTRHDSDRELIGQGIGNLVSGIVGGLPGAGATMGTVVNIQTGARSPLASLTRSLILLLVVLVIGPLLSVVPTAVLAAIAVKVGMDILDWSFLGRAHRISLQASLIMYGVLVLTVLVDVIVAVGAGVFVANILTVERLSRLQETGVRTIDPSGDPVVLDTEERELLEAAGDSVVLFHLSGPMIFGVAQAIARETAAMKAGASVLIIDLAEVNHLSTTIALALENVVLQAVSAERSVIISGAHGQAASMLRKLGLEAPGVRWVDTRLTAIREAVKNASQSSPPG